MGGCVAAMWPFSTMVFDGRNQPQRGRFAPSKTMERKCPRRAIGRLFKTPVFRRAMAVNPCEATAKRRLAKSEAGLTASTARARGSRSFGVSHVSGPSQIELRPCANEAAAADINGPRAGSLKQAERGGG